MRLDLQMLLKVESNENGGRRYCQERGGEVDLSGSWNEEEAAVWVQDPR